MSIFKTGV